MKEANRPKYHKVKEKHLEKLKIFLKKQNEHINKGEDRT